MKIYIWLALATAIAVAAGGFLGWQQFRPETVYEPGVLQELELPDVNKSVRNGEEWLGKVVVVNHWATWCPPCREEIPLLIEYQDRLGSEGLQVVGIAHDMLDATRSFGDSMGINYPSLVAITGGDEIMNRHGAKKGGALPFTAFFDRQGNLVSTQLGQVHAEDIEAVVLPLLERKP